jgi:hypothetical protein
MLFCRATQTGAIWLTALMTLVAGSPHFDCRCPNGHIKPFCLALLAGKSGCCCEGSCCSASTGDDARDFAAHSYPSATVPRKACCCKAHPENATDESRNAPQLGKVCCQKTIAVAAVGASEPSVKAPVRDLTAHLLVPAPGASMGQDGFGVCDCLFANHYHRPPPTDLVTVLQRYLI